MTAPAPPVMPLWLARQLSFRRAMVDVGGFAMHVMEQGDGLPVLLLHGNPTWGFLWRRVAAELSSEPLRLVMPDLIGLGLSDHPRDARVHTVELHARTIGSLVDALGLKRFVLVVQDWGGPIGALMASERPEALAGLVVLNTVLGPPRPGFRPTTFHRFAKLPLLSDLVFRGLLFPARGMGLAQGDRSSVKGDVERAYRWVLRDRRSNGAPLWLARMVPSSLEHPSVPALRRCEAWASGFQGPSAIVWGDRDPVLGRVFKRIHALLPKATVTRTQAGHFLQEEVPEEIAQAIRDVAARARTAAP